MTQATDFSLTLLGKSSRLGRNDPRPSSANMLSHSEFVDLAIAGGMVDSGLDLALSEFDNFYRLEKTGVARLLFTDGSTLTVTLVGDTWLGSVVI